MKTIRKLTWCLIALVPVAAAVGCTSSSVRIDGSSQGAFERTNEEMLKSLSPSDQIKLAGAELYISAAAIQQPSGGRSSVVPLGAVRVQVNGKMLEMLIPVAAVRAELNGKTFEEILQDASRKPKDIKGQAEVSSSQQ